MKNYLTPFVEKKMVSDIKLEDLTSNNLDKVETAILNCQKVSEQSKFFMAVGFYHIYHTGIYKQAHDTVQEYLAHLEGHDIIDRREAHRLIRIGQNFETYRSRLEKAGFRPKKNTIKLYHLDKAAERHGQARAVNALMSMSQRKFMEFAVGTTPALDYTRLDIELEITGAGIKAEGKDVLKFRDVEKIVQAGEKPLLIGVQDNGEAQALRVYLKKLRQKK